MKKQLNEEIKRWRMMKKMRATANDLPTDPNKTVEQETGSAASFPVPMPDLALPVSFDSDNPTHKYRYLDSSNKWLVRPILEPNGWDHDVGYEGINVERLFAIKDKIPTSFSSKSVGKDIDYTLRSSMFGRGNVADGGSLEAILRDKDHHLGRFPSTLGLSVMDWHGDLAIGCNSQTQIPVGQYTNLIGRVNINNKGSGQVSIHLNNSEQLQIALISLLPLVRKLISYTQPVQFR
ncbi:hypothetical protein K7X08_004391 [Anisodus acutangulus]|uniref:Translocase of chloroplast 159/132 membrane anchor domain-containing protein n=1 Tax=Anisodus acutangulus TaxID=402998 RepID=A0A9Q1MHH3_9SOLA|nr:hypothetical protein K7X08_004391 [Anisodus acutangulus]